MIILRDCRIVILTPPKVASSALHDFCCSTKGGIHVCGETEGCFDHHTTRIPDAFRDFRIAVVVRHPLDRLVSLWHHLVRWNAMHGDGCCDFSTFVAMAETGKPKLHWIFQRTISEYLGEIEPAAVLRFESIVADLERLTGWKGVQLPIVAAQVSTRRPWRKYYNRDSLESAARWAAPDLKRFHY